MQDFERRKLEAVLFFALVICGGAVRSPIASSRRLDGARDRRIGDLGMLQEVGNLRSCRNRVHGKRRLGLVNLGRIIFHRKLAGHLSALGVAAWQQGRLGTLNRSLIVLVIALGKLNLALGPRRIGFTCVEFGRSLALLGVATRQQRCLGAFGLYSIGHVDKRVLILVLIVQNRIDLAAHNRSHGSIRALLTQNAQVRAGDTGNRKCLIVTPGALVDVGTTALGKISRTVAGRTQDAAHRKADDDKADDGQAQQDHHRNGLTQGILQGTRNKRTDVATRGGQVLRHEHKVTRVTGTRHHKRQDRDDGDKDHGAARNGAHIERRIIAQKERGGKQQNNDRQHVGTQAKAQVVETGNRSRHRCGRRRNHGNERCNRQNGDDHTGDIAIGRRLDQRLKIVELSLMALIGTKMGTGTLSRCRLVVGFIAFGVLCRSARQTKPP